MTTLKCLFTGRNPEIPAVGDGNNIHKLYYFNSATGVAVKVHRKTMALMILAHLIKKAGPSYEFF